MHAEARTATMERSATTASPKQYRIGERLYGEVSGEAMTQIFAVRGTSQVTDPLEFLRTVAEANAGNDAVLADLYVYGRFEFGLHTRVLGDLFRPLMRHEGVLRDTIKNVGCKSVDYRSKTGKGPAVVY